MNVDRIEGMRFSIVLQQFNLSCESIKLSPSHLYGWGLYNSLSLSCYPILLCAFITYVQLGSFSCIGWYTHEPILYLVDLSIPFHDDTRSFGFLRYNWVPNSSLTRTVFCFFFQDSKQGYIAIVRLLELELELESVKREKCIEYLYVLFF